MDDSIRARKPGELEVRRIIHITPPVNKNTALLEVADILDRGGRTFGDFIRKWTPSPKMMNEHVREYDAQSDLPLFWSIQDSLRAGLARSMRETGEKPRVRFLTKQMDEFRPRAGGEWVCMMVRPSYFDKARFDVWSTGVLWCRQQNAILARKRLFGGINYDLMWKDEL